MPSSVKRRLRTPLSRREPRAALPVSRRPAAAASRASSTPERPEECADVVGQEVRRLQRREVAAAWHPCPPPEIEGALGPNPRRAQDLAGKLRVPRRHLDAALGQGPATV